MHAAFIILAAALAAVLFLRIRITLKDDGNDRAVLKVLVWRLPVYSARLCLKLKNGVLPELFAIRGGKRRRVWYLGEPKKRGITGAVLDAAIKAHHAKRLLLKVNIGLGDAAASALVCGALNAALDVMIKSRANNVDSARAGVFPDFEKNGVHFMLDCIITVRAADIIREMIFSKERRKENAPYRKHFKSKHVRA